MLHNNEQIHPCSRIPILAKLILLIVCVLYFSKADAQNNTIFSGGSGDGFSVGHVGSWDNEVPLPIDLISFTGKCHDGKIISKWSSASETNNEYFTIERSTNGKDWINIGMVEGAGNSSTILNYSFTDTEPYNSISYYRLKQTDYNGQFKYSKIISVVNCKEDLAELTIYPNPVNGKLTLIFNDNVEQVYSIEIFSLLGERVFYSGGYQPEIDMSNQPADVYFIHFNFKYQRKPIVKKIVIER